MRTPFQTRPQPHLAGALLFAALLLLPGCDGLFTEVEEPLSPSMLQRLEATFGAPLDPARPEVMAAIQREYEPFHERVVRAEVRQGTLLVTLAAAVPTAAEKALAGMASGGSDILNPWTLGSGALNMGMLTLLIMQGRARRKEEREHGGGK